MNATESNEFNAIREWLNGDRNYTRGRIIYGAFTKNSAIRRSLEKFKNEPLLLEVMTERYDELKPDDKGETVSDKYPKGITESPEIDKGEAILPIPSDNRKDIEIQIQKIAAAFGITPEHIGQVLENAAPRLEQIRLPRVSGEEIVSLGKVALPSSAAMKRKQKCDADLKQLFKDRGRFHSEMCAIAYHNDGRRKIKLTESDIERRLQLNKLIVGADKMISQIFVDLNYYALHGKFPNSREKRAEKPKPITNAEALKELKNSVNPNISKISKKIETKTAELPKIDNPKIREKAMKAIAKWNSQLEIFKVRKKELQTKLNEPDTQTTNT